MNVKAYALEIYKEHISRLEGSLPGEQFPQAEGGSLRKWSEEGPLPAQITKKGTDLRTVLEYRAALRPLWRGAPGLQTCSPKPAACPGPAWPSGRLPKL